MRPVRLEGGPSPSDPQQLVATADRLEAEPRVPVLRPVALVRHEEGQLVAVRERRLERARDHRGSQAAAAEALDRRDLVDLADAAVLEERAERADLALAERREQA